MGVLSVLLVPFFILIFQKIPIENEQSFCPVKMITGFPCPGCGITKSIIFFYEGEWLKSLSYHLFGPLLILVSLFLIFVFLFELFKGKVYLKKNIFNKRLTYCFAILLAIYHIIRLILFVKENSLSSILKESIWN